MSKIKKATASLVIAAVLAIPFIGIQTDTTKEFAARDSGPSFMYMDPGGGIGN
ncbi:hypothetical protein NC797_07680 [Aquibacillus sp. 3ASR75-11]|uniref:Uncharacterized protein n=1 Tax=Terrihalobacillus insolitus TaxID=2950438 RepID=A0A9X3WUC1_9BACI|nr:hypothetical protein [Terrihalobacillus insolitus]MDC3424386.1 hypothetical protein [Terrihalobacillus insolitus]